LPLKPVLWDFFGYENHVTLKQVEPPKNLLLFFNVIFVKIKILEIEHFIAFNCSIFCVSSIQFDYIQLPTPGEMILKLNVWIEFGY